MTLTRRKFARHGLLWLPTISIFTPKLLAVPPPGGSGSRLPNSTSLPLGAAAGGGGGGGGGASFTFVQKNHSVSAANAATQTVQLTGVVAGNLILVGGKSEGINGTTVTGISDGTTAFTVSGPTDHANNDLRWVFGYLLSSVASGTVTYTITHSAATPAFFWTFAYEFSGGGTRAFDAANGASATNTNVNSGNITTGTAVAVAVGSYGHYSSGTLTAIQIGGVNKDGCEPTTPGASESAMWYRILSGVMTNGAATGTIASAEWASRILSIKAT